MRANGESGFTLEPSPVDSNQAVVALAAATPALSRSPAISKRHANTAKHKVPNANTISPGTRIHTQASMKAECTTSGERANHMPSEMLAHA